MRRARALPVLLAGAAVVFGSETAGATGFTDIGEDIVPRTDVAVHVNGYLRARAVDLYNLDLDRGLTPSGQPLFPVPLGNPNAQSITYADMRLRTDIAAYAPGGMVAVKARFDILDNVALGSDAQGVPSSSASQLSPSNALRVKRAWGEALTPIGLLAVGRIGSTWGLGMLANGGDCADCNYGDAADRIALITPLARHIFALAYDIDQIGPFVPQQAGGTTLNLSPSADVHTVTFAFLRYKDDLARDRRRLADKTTVEYGAYLSERWQDDDVPGTYLPTAQPLPITSSQIMARGYQATAVDGWARVTHPFFRVEAEWALVAGRIDQASLIPGVLYHQPVTATQMGAALESDVGPPESRVGAGLDGGYASGDPSPGFGAFPQIGAPAARPGDLNGAKANPPSHTTVDNFAFHPDYFVDRILFREIIGTVTGAVYARPHARWDVMRVAPGVLQASVAAIASWAVYPENTPGGKAPLGVEIDPTLAYASRDGFGVALEYAVLFPMAGLDNPVAHLNAFPAQLARARVMYRF
ncbi:MAG TPA: TIGR04551 family protein [Polyangiaceae bacterium]